MFPGSSRPAIHCRPNASPLPHRHRTRTCGAGFCPELGGGRRKRGRRSRPERCFLRDHLSGPRPRRPGRSGGGRRGFHWAARALPIRVPPLGRTRVGRPRPDSPGRKRDRLVPSASGVPRGGERDARRGLHRHRGRPGSMRGRRWIRPRTRRNSPSDLLASQAALPRGRDHGRGGLRRPPLRGRARVGSGRHPGWRGSDRSRAATSVRCARTSRPSMRHRTRAASTCSWPERRSRARPEANPRRMNSSERF